MRRQRLVPALALGALVAGAAHCGARGTAGGANAPASAPATSTGASPVPSAPATVDGAASPSSTAAPVPTRSASGAATAAEIPPAPRFASTVFAVKTDPAARACAAPSRANGKAPTANVAANVTAAGAACARATRMKPAAKTVTGEQSDAQAPQSFPLRAQANHCYRVYAQGGAGLQDFTLALRDSAGAAIDVHAQGGAAVLPEDGALCFHADDAASIVFATGMGTGPFALQIWGD